MPNPFIRGTPHYQMYEESMGRGRITDSDEPLEEIDTVMAGSLDPWPSGMVEPTGVRFEYSPGYIEEPPLRANVRDYESRFRRRLNDNAYQDAPLDSWMTRDGTVIKIEDLQTPHLLSILSVLYKDRDRAPQQRNKMVSLEKEVVKRFTA